MRFVEWLSRLPQKIVTSEFVQFVAPMFALVFLLAWMMWHLIFGPQIFALIPLFVGLYILYYAEEKNLWWT